MKWVGRWVETAGASYTIKYNSGGTKRRRHGTKQNKTAPKSPFTGRNRVKGVSSSLPASSIVAIVSPVVPEGTAADGVDDDEEYEEHNVHHRYFLPFTPDVVQQAGLARLAVETQHAGIVVP